MPTELPAPSLSPASPLIGAPQSRCSCWEKAYPINASKRVTKGTRTPLRCETAWWMRFMIVGRLFGWILFLAGFSVLVRDVLVWIDTKHWAPIALGQLWFDLNRSSLNLIQAVIQRYIHPFLWDPIIVTILLCWAFAVLMVLGLLILTLSGSLARRRSRSGVPLSRRPS